MRSLDVARDIEPGRGQTGVKLLVLRASLSEAAEREVQDLEREPAPQRREARRLGVVAALRDRHRRMSAVRDLHLRVERVDLCGVRGARRDAHRHPLGEVAPVVGTRSEVLPRGAHDPVPRRNRLEDLRDRAAARPPELVPVGVQHPVGAVLGRGQSRHLRATRRDPLAGVAEETHVALPLVALEDLGRSVDREVIGRYDEVDARVQVERDEGIDEIGLVARAGDQDDAHRPPR